MSRMSGRSTRLIDKYIQMLFKDGSIKVSDHGDSHPSNKHRDGDIYIKVCARLKLEHSGCMDKMFFDPSRLSIKYLQMRLHEES